MADGRQQWRDTERTVDISFSTEPRRRHIALTHSTGRPHTAVHRMRRWISSTRQAVIRGPSLTGRGYRPDLTPAHQVLLETGINAGTGG